MSNDSLSDLVSYPDTESGNNVYLRPSNSLSIEAGTIVDNSMTSQNFPVFSNALIVHAQSESYREYTTSIMGYMKRSLIRNVNALARQFC